MIFSRIIKGLVAQIIPRVSWETARVLFARIAEVLDHAKIDHEYLDEILSRHDLTDRWVALRRSLHGKE